MLRLALASGCALDSIKATISVQLRTDDLVDMFKVHTSLMNVILVLGENQQDPKEIGMALMQALPLRRLVVKHPINQ